MIGLAIIVAFVVFCIYAVLRFFNFWFPSKKRSSEILIQPKPAPPPVKDISVYKDLPDEDQSHEQSKPTVIINNTINVLIVNLKKEEP